MEEKIFNFTLELDWKILEQLRTIEKFELHWSNKRMLESSGLLQLKQLATLQSIGSSTRIEGSQLSDVQVQTLLEKIDVSEFEDRDSQEVVGYSNVLELIACAPHHLKINEATIKNLHQVLLKFSEKDDWHRGEYKKHSNAVQANFPDGSTQIIFRTTEPGYLTEDAMCSLIRWFNEKNHVNPIVKAAVFVYEFLSIHPFQDGNGRLSRLLTTLLLLQSGYEWVEYISFEHEVERRKKAYYQALRNCQAKRPNEDIREWVSFFVDSLLILTQKLTKKLELTESDLTPKQKSAYIFVCNNPEARAAKIIKGTDIPRATLKRVLNVLIELDLIEKNGKGPGTNYRKKAETIL